MITEQYNDIDILLHQLAKYCIKHNLHRQGNKFYWFSEDELKSMNDMCTSEHKITLDGGYMFLDNPNGNEGMIRLHCLESNPKWSFWMENGELQVDFA